MQTSILFKAPGRSANRPIVILTGPAIGAEYSTPISTRLSRTLSSLWQWTRCNCTPRRIVSTLFSARVSGAFAALFLAALLWHNISITDTVEAQRALGVDCLLALPYAIAWVLRPSATKGGEK